MTGLQHQPPFNFMRVDSRDMRTFSIGGLVWVFDRGEWKHGVVQALEGQRVLVETEETKMNSWPPLEFPNYEEDIWPRTPERK